VLATAVKLHILTLAASILPHAFTQMTNTHTFSYLTEDTIQTFVNYCIPFKCLGSFLKVSLLTKAVVNTVIL